MVFGKFLIKDPPPPPFFFFPLLSLACVVSFFLLVWERKMCARSRDEGGKAWRRRSPFFSSGCLYVLRCHLHLLFCPFSSPRKGEGEGKERGPTQTHENEHSNFFCLPPFLESSPATVSLPLTLPPPTKTNKHHKQKQKQMEQNKKRGRRMFLRNNGRRIQKWRRGSK